jgi:hypothetical protein
VVADGRVVSRSKRVLEAVLFLWVVGVDTVMVMGINLRGVHHDWQELFKCSQKDTHCLDRQWKHTKELSRAHEVNL